MNEVANSSPGLPDSVLITFYSLEKKDLVWVNLEEDCASF